jgi:hypothetical protein
VANLDLKKSFDRFLSLAALPENAGDPVLAHLEKAIGERSLSGLPPCVRIVVARPV